MEIRYDVLIKTRGYFSFFNQSFHAPGMLYNVTQNHLDVIAQLHWEFEVISEHEDDDPSVVKVFFPVATRQYVVPTEKDLDNIQGIKANDKVTILCTNTEFIYV